MLDLVVKALESVTAVVILVSWVKYGVKWIRAKINKTRTSAHFVEAMATNHLPHVYHRLERIDAKLDIAPEEPPKIDF